LRGSGDESRDFIHAVDVARALVLLVECAPSEGEIYNLATGRETSIRELAEVLLAHLGSTITPEFDGYSAPGDPRNWRADIARIQTLGFRPTVALEDGLRGAAVWTLAELRGSSSP
jgi:UDP-glucose 4-epimerase